jgi:hypothetical protein
MAAYKVPLVGESRYQAAIAGLAEGDIVTLVREPDNPYDPAAVSARTAAGETIGYIARGHWIQEVAAQEQAPISATVSAINGGTPDAPSLGVVLTVDMGAQSDPAATLPLAAPVANVDALAAMDGCGRALKNLGCALVMLPIAVVAIAMLFS